jgi:ATP-dependent helicase/nuclease subunit A
MEMTDLADAAARSRILTDYGTTLFVEAAAGTGKTTVLVGRIVGLIRSGGGTLAQTVAVTFTEKAAGEMKLRLRLEIEKARTEATLLERGRLDRALEELELARIGTIHAFCGDLLSERPIEAGIDPVFTMLAEQAAGAIVDEAFDRWLQRVLADPPEGPRRVLRRRSGRDTPQEQLRTAMRTLCGHRDFAHPWRRDPFDRNGAIDALVDELKELGDIASASSWRDDWLTRNLEEIALFVREATRLETVRGRDYDGLEAELRQLARARGWERKGAPRTTFGTLSRNEVLARREDVRATLRAFLEACEADLAPLLHDALQTAVVDYERTKSKSGCLDFLDLLIKARDLIRGDEAIRRELQGRFAHFFVDEFQDTDPLQAEILLLLAADDPTVTDWRSVRPVAGKLFLVGDPKQAIYRFRRADVALYEEIKMRLLGVGAELLHLTTSFRALPSIQRFVNCAFATAIGGDAEASGYVALDPWRPELAERPTIVALPVPRPYGDYGRITNWSIDRSMPNAVGSFIDWLVRESGWTVDEAGKKVAIRPRHIAILFRRFRNGRTDVTRPYVHSLEARRVPHVLVGGRSFHDREEIIALRNVMAAIEWPDDELKVFATLRGPFFAFSDEALLVFRQRIQLDGTLTRRRLNPMQPIDREDLGGATDELADALQLLRRLHVGRNGRPIPETISMFLQDVRAHAGIALWPNGEQALANCQRLLDMARRFDRRASSFRAFVESVEADAERGEADEAPIVEEGTEGVRVMTVYKAKGLEFPVVILADPTCNAVREVPSRHIDGSRSLWLEQLCGATPVELREASELEMKRDRAEAIRVAYVAATRARDLLVVPVCGDQLIEGWFEALAPAVYPMDEWRRHSSSSPGCPSFGEDSVLERGPMGKRPVIGSVRPGLHAPAPEVPVTWWDPATLTLEVEEMASLRHQRLLQADTGGTAAAESEESYRAWKLERRTLLAKAADPSLRVRTVTSLANANNTPAVALEMQDENADRRVEIETVERHDLYRPGGRRFGTLVHALLATVTLSADPQSIKSLALAQGKIVGATEDEIDAAVTTAVRVLAHPLLRRAAAAAINGGLRREIPVLLKINDGSLAEGVVDLAFQEQASDFTGWTVVDFKTDRELEGFSDRYVAQVQLYSRAVREATNLPTRGVLLVI